MRKLFNSRYAVGYAFVGLFLGISFLLRFLFFAWSLSKATFTVSSVISIFFKGFIFDFGVATFFLVLYAIYLLFIPEKWNKSLANKIITYTGFSLVLVITMFSFFAEFAFWNEFESRFNFIAVDYLIYTYEVINNINESYPLPLLIGGMIIAVLLIIWGFYKINIFQRSFRSDTSFSQRAVHTGAILALALCYAVVVKNSWAENSSARYPNELSKAGIYSFFAAFKSNELNYVDFYKLLDNKKAFELSRKLLLEPGAVFQTNEFSIRRAISPISVLQKPNVIMITIESMSADFLKYFGNKENITPVMDSLINNSLFFSNFYATGNRTVRGMEALTLSIPPTPGSSIVRRDNNDDLITIGSTFKKAGYDCNFFYGGDGYFDNMNKFFGNNGYDVTDRAKRMLPADNFKSQHNIINDTAVHFENAWGICDEDLYDAVIRDADTKYQHGKGFYDFVMTTSNHRPYTFPAGKINIPSGSGRPGAVKYTDYAIGKFLSNIKNKPWYPNTIIILVADHCANSAGKNDINIDKYHIPCWVLNLKGIKNTNISQMCSQIDLYPTLFNLLGWNYESNFFGQDVLSDHYVPRIFCGTYQKLAYMKKDSLVILGPQKAVQTFIYNKQSNSQTPVNFTILAEEAIAQYQAAYYLFKNNGLKQQ